MLSIHNLSKSYGIQPVLQNINFNISAGERIGLIGPNGSGKTTLMRILAKLEQPDAGRGDVSSTRPNLRIGYLAQGMDLDPRQTLHTALGLDPATQTDPAAEIESLALALSQNPNDSALQTQYDHALTKLSALNLQPETILAPLGLDHLPADTPIAHLSGGQKTRLMLARVLLEEPQLLLLDEPTNHLDIEMLEWLEEWLNQFQGAALIVSHDRVFLDNTVTSILELNPITHGIRMYAGTYSDYMEAKQKEQDKQWDEYRDQETEIRRMKDDINRTKQQALHVELTTTPRQPGVRRIAKKVAVKAKSREKKLDRYLRSDERVDKPLQGWHMKLELGEPEHQSKIVLETDSLSIGYALESPLLENINLFIRAGQRIVLTGPNGAGKTSFIRTIVGRIPPLAGSFRLGGATKLGYMAQEQELLNPKFSALQTIQSVSAFNETDARNFLHYFLFKGDAALRASEELSYGERARLQLATLVAQGCTFLVLDEPINHLDISSRERFEEALENFKGTILAVVHDRSFIDRFASDVWVAKDGKISK
ncbi:MAG TPA: ABC-F family ATP-binding cassette domain-containing protein [Anaerolineales bacterium]|nr:ABC-F family ATP-binding cassette domain-containing protein [Anaerolineales bacterium]HNC88487.1 ABC-F family ATP-binding cassette domain-containing protein [Anaerolineales bacterium]HND90746.1 ABC-F family ATP-binding cassette domain-containing protein [Anaerolineales bacterium]HNO84745.1 ABC-F family ATP-binding cassette domain-containing protein [Anaerolineales bacterium]